MMSSIAPPSEWQASIGWAKARGAEPTTFADRHVAGFAPLSPPCKIHPASSFLALRKSALIRVCQPRPVLR